MNPMPTSPTGAEDVRVAVVGAGARGAAYADYLLDRVLGARVVAIAEPDPTRARELAARHDVGGDRVVADWSQLLAHTDEFDAVVIATGDRLHADPAIAFADAGVHILLEKPMAPTEKEAQAIVEAVERNGTMLMVCHVLRYTPYLLRLKQLLADGAIGTVMGIEHLEPVGWWHFAHSYVRGNWAHEAESSSMLLAKASHDVDLLAHLLDDEVVKVSSFGSLGHFRRENRPPGATDRCVTCPLQDTCAYSATQIYGRFAEDPDRHRWPLEVLTPHPDAASIDEALRTGPYGRCVYLGDNDAVDHQVVIMETANGATASLTVMAFTELDFRQTRVFGTRGRIHGDGRRLEVLSFETGEESVLDLGATDGASAAEGHGGADLELVKAFVAAVRTHDPSLLLTDPRTSLRSHQLVWAAERARLAGEVVHLTEPQFR